MESKIETTLETKGVTVLYNHQPVIEDISISVGTGEIIALLGQSGVGKTTLFKVLTGIILPDKGKIYYNNRDITGKQGNLGYMLQSDLLLPYKTLYDNVTLPLQIQRKSAPEIEEIIFPLLEQFGLLESRFLYPSQLSGGMGQRAAFLRTVVGGHTCILLDEPFSHLDRVTKKNMQAWFLATATRLGMTVVVITHDIDEAYILAKKIYVMKGTPGKINIADCIIPHISDRMAIQAKERSYQQLLE